MAEKERLVAQQRGSSDARAVPPPPLRADLKFQIQTDGHERFVVIKDPIALHYFRVPEQDFQMATLFDGKRPLSEICQMFRAQHPHLSLNQSLEATEKRAQAFWQDLARRCCLEMGANASIRERIVLAEKNARKPWNPLVWFMKLMFLRITLVNPDRFLGWLAARISWVWSRPAQILSHALILAGLVVFMTNLNKVGESFGSFFTLGNLVLVWALTLGVKVIHELGHGLACKHYGGEVYEAGIMFMIFSPFFYVNVSDSYLFARSRDRISVIAAGIYTELMIAAVTAIFWSISQPGVTQQILFNLMVVTSFWTVVFNANPLMKFDGYYILSEIVKIPNLRTRAQVYVSFLIERFLFGKADHGQLARVRIPDEKRVFLALYAVLSYFYSLVVTFRIAVLLFTALEGVNLGFIGLFLAGNAILTMAILPILNFFKKVQLKLVDMKPNGRVRIAGIRLWPFLLLAGGALFIPINAGVRSQCVLRPFRAEVIRAPESGVFEQVLVDEGQFVKTGDPLATLRNWRVEEQYQLAEKGVTSATKEMELALGLQSPSELILATTKKEEAMARFNNADYRRQLLTLKANLDGVVITPDLKRSHGKSIMKQEIFCELASLNPIQMQIPVSQKQVREIQKGQRVELRCVAYPGQNFLGTVLETPKTQPVNELPSAMVAGKGGAIQATPSPDREGVYIPLEKVYLVLVELSNPDGTLRPGMTGHVWIRVPAKPLWKWIKNAVLDYVSFDFRL
jgi:putative peptide zinc metalloprotease protein